MSAMANMPTYREYLTSNSFENPGYVEPEEDTIDYTITNDVVGSNVDKEAATTSDEVESDFNDEATERYGWFSWRPDCLQWINNPKGYLFFLCVYCFGQGMTVNGLVYVVITTLERRFNLPSVKSAFISSAYDFMSMFFIICVTYFLEKSNKPKVIGIGALIFACGSIVFTLPHFLTGLYNFEAAEFDTCDFNRTEPDLCSIDDAEEDLSKYYAVFIIAQGLHALGASSLYNLGLTYVDENSPPGSAAVYTAIFWTMCTLGPAAGFLIGGMFLDIYTDFTANDVNITPTSPLWVGAWWLGFVITACVCLLVSVPLLGFNKHLPTYRAAQKQRARETRQGATFKTETTSVERNKVKDFPKAIWKLITNPTYLFLNLGVVCEAFLLAIISVFGPKILESLFNVSSGNAALIAGLVLTPAGIVGPITSGYLTKRYDLKVGQLFKFCIACLCVSGAFLFGFLLSCPNVPFAGVTVVYQNTTQDHSGDTDLIARCNENCNCEDSFDPVCGSDDIMYYSSCHAGCMTELEGDEGGHKHYANCSCIASGLVDSSPGVFVGTATAGRCTHKCASMVPWLLILFVGLLFMFMVAVPNITVTIRCVDYSQRSFALGFQALMAKSLGVVPGPIAFGALIDKSCILWEYGCNGSMNCWMYGNWQLSMYTMLVALGCRIGSITFYSLALLSYKPSVEDQKEAGDGGGGNTGDHSMKYVIGSEKVEMKLAGQVD